MAVDSNHYSDHSTRSKDSVVTMVSDWVNGSAVYTVLDINNTVIITTTSYKLAQNYFQRAQQWGTVMRVWAVDQYLERFRPRPRC